MIKMVVSDIDGTLLKEGTSNLKKEYFTIFDKLYRKGVKVVIASGRNYNEVDGIFHSMRNKAYYISCNGGVITYKNKIIYKKVMDEKKLIEMINYIRNNERISYHPLLTALLDNKQYAEKKSKEKLLFLKKSYKSKCVFIDDILNGIKNCTKLNIFDETAEERKKITDIITKAYGKYFNVVVSGKRWIDICDKEATKGIALKYLQNLFDVRKEETICIGDNFNDISMLSCAKYSFVPTISTYEVKRKAKYVIPSYEYDGPLKVFEAVYNYGIKK